MESRYETFESAPGAAARAVPRAPAVGPALAVLWAKWRIVRHTIASVRNESKLKVSFITFSAAVLWLGAFGLFYYGLGWLYRFGAEAGGAFGVGHVVMVRLAAVLCLALFFLLIFSNVLVAFATLYRSREMAYLIHTPLNWRALFLVRFGECLVFSSWASVYVGSPLVLAWGIVTDASPMLYAAAAAFFVPFVTVPAALGAIIAMALVRVFPALNRGTLIGLGLAAVAVFFYYLRHWMSAARLAEDSILQSILEATQQSQSPFLPSAWFVQGLLTAAEGNHYSAAFYFLLLTANALMATLCAAELANRLFYAGWSGLLGQDRVRLRPLGRGILGRLDMLLGWLRNPARALVVKDLKLFWRDPAQWSQFIIFFGLMAVYIANLGNRRVHAADDSYRAWISSLNIGACMLILATLTSRFVYPLISLEGRRFWILGLAPVPFRRLVWQKFWLSVACTSVFTVGLTVLSGYQLQLRPLWFFLALYSVAAANLSLSGLAVGLGSLYPNFQEDNPARIVSGMGGTLNFLLSFAYIVLVVSSLTALIVWQFLSRIGYTGRFMLACTAVLAFITALSVLTTLLPLRLGLRNLDQMEY